MQPRDKQAPAPLEVDPAAAFARRLAAQLGEGWRIAEGGENTRSAPARQRCRLVSDTLAAHADRNARGLYVTVAPERPDLAYVLGCGIHPSIQPNAGWRPDEIEQAATHVRQVLLPFCRRARRWQILTAATPRRERTDQVLRRDLMRRRIAAPEPAQPV